MENANRLDSSQNIVEIISAFAEHSKDIENVVVTLSKSIENISKKVDPKTFKTAKQKMEVVVSGIQDYLNVMSDIITELANPRNGIKFDDEFAKTMLGFDKRLEGQLKALEDQGPEGKKVTEPIENMIELNKKSSVPQQILAFSNIIGNMFTSFMKIGDALKNPVAILKFKIAMKLFQSDLRDMVNIIATTFNGLDLTSINRILDVLVSEPEKVETTMRSINKSTQKKQDLDITNNTTTTKGKQGLLDVITNVLNIFQLLTNLPVPTPVIFGLKLKWAMSCLNDMWASIKEFADSNSFNNKKIEAMDKSFEKLISTYISIKTIVGHVQEIGTIGNTIKTRLARTNVEIIFGLYGKEDSIYVMLSDLIEDENFEDLCTKETLEKLENFNKIVIKLRNIAINLSIIGLLTAPLLLAFAGLLVFRAVIWLLFTLFDKETIDRINETKEGFISMTIAIMALSMCALLLSLTGMLIIEDWTNYLIVAGFLLLVTGIFWLVALAVKFLKEEKADKGLLYIAATVMLLSLTVVILALTGQLITEEWGNVLKTLAFLGGLVAVFVIIGLASKHIEGGSRSMLWIALSVAILALIVFILVPIAEMITAKWEQILKVGLFMLILVGAMWGLAKAASSIMTGAGLLIVMALTLIVFSASIYIIAMASQKLRWRGVIALVVAVVGMLAVMLVGLSFEAPLIGIGIALLLAMGAGMMMFAISFKVIVDTLEKITAMKLDPEKDKAKLMAPVKIMWDTIKEASSYKMENLAKGVAKIVAIGMASSSISNIGDTIQKFASLRMPTKFDKNGKPIEFVSMQPEDFEKAAKNISTVLTWMIATVGSEEMTEMLDRLSIKSAINLSLIMDATSGVTNLIDAIEKSVKFKPETITTGINNIKQAITEYCVALDSLFGEETKIKWGQFGGILYPTFEKIGNPLISEDRLENIRDSVEILAEIVTPTKDLIEAIETMSNIDSKKTGDVGKIIQGYINSIYGDENGKGGIQINKNVKVQNAYLRFLVDQQERLSKVNPGDLQKNVDNFVKFVDKANKIDVNRIMTVRDMFEQMAEFSKSVQGDFDKLADVLSEKLFEILEKLHITLKDIYEKDTEKPAEAAAITENTGVPEQTATKEDAKDKEKAQAKQDLKEIQNSMEEICNLLTAIRTNTEENNFVFSQYK